MRAKRASGTPATSAPDASEALEPEMLRIIKAMAKADARRDASLLSREVTRK